MPTTNISSKYIFMKIIIKFFSHLYIKNNILPYYTLVFLPECEVMLSSILICLAKQELKVIMPLLTAPRSEMYMNISIHSSPVAMKLTLKGT